jgi:predicted secreted hydrolase
MRIRFPGRLGLAPALILLGGGLLAAELPGTPPAPGTPSEPWQRAIGPWAWSFPRDHGAHPGFKSEWWYFTGNLQDAQRRRFGFQLTLFRQGVQFKPAQVNSKWGVRDFYFGHFTISDIAADQFHVEERVSRGALGEAGSATGHMDVKLGSWTIQQQGADDDYKLSAHSADLDLDLDEHAAKPLVLEGVGGLSQKDKGAGEASYYYSYPRLATTGRIRIGSQTYPVTGQSWFDHEFSTGSLGQDQVGWDWFCLQLDDHEEIMLYVMRDKSGAMDPVSQGTWVRADGSSVQLPPGSFTVQKTATWTSPGSGAVYPAGWHIVVPAHHADLTVSPAMADQELRLNKMGALDYWEGACTSTGTIGNLQVTGVGYTELTGYAGSLRAGFEK